MTCGWVWLESLTCPECVGGRCVSCWWPVQVPVFPMTLVWIRQHSGGKEIWTIHFTVKRFSIQILNSFIWIIFLTYCQKQYWKCKLIGLPIKIHSPGKVTKSLRRPDTHQKKLHVSNYQPHTLLPSITDVIKIFVLTKLDKSIYCLNPIFN